jgi:hypothetical protein
VLLHAAAIRAAPTPATARNRIDVGLTPRFYPGPLNGRRSSPPAPPAPI